MSFVHRGQPLRLSLVAVGVAAAAALGQGVRDESRGSGAAARRHLLVLLSEALESFDRGSALLNTAPDDALAAFREARDKFQVVVDAGIENGRLYYNLGNAHLRLGEIGKSIADYRRAARLTPDDEQLKANLRFARSLRRDQIAVSGKRALLQTVFLWHYSLPLRTRLAAAVAVYGLFWLLLAVRVLAPRVRLGYVTLLCLVLWVGLGTSAAVDLPSQGALTEGVLTANDVVVRKGNGEGYDPQFKQPLHEGVEFKIVERRGGWIHIELDDGNRGWVRQHEVEVF
ncbi:MAG: tetratricopeptide repeat protein [Phycisphaerae bacterium]